jgi:hypothetical protein
MLARIGFALAALAAAGPAHGAVALEVLKPAGENLLKADAWRPYDRGFARDGETFVCDNHADDKARRGASQTVVLNQAVPAPIIATAWSKAEGVGGGADPDYSVYLDLVYQDGSPLWGQVGTFRTGTHEWQKAEVTVFPARPIKSLTFYLLLRNHSGKAWFRDAQLAAPQTPDGAAMFDGLAVRVRAALAPAWLVRDVAAGSDFVTADDARSLGLDLKTDDVMPRTAVPFLSARLSDTTGKDRAVTLVFVMPAPCDGWRWLAGPREERPAVAPLEYVGTRRVGNVGAGGGISWWPFAAIARQERGVALLADLANPAFLRTGYSAGAQALYAAFDLGLAPERPSAEVGLRRVLFDGRQGFRGMVARMYELCADAFRSRTPDQGLWMPFYAVSKVKGWEDFGFKFKEGNDETAWDDAHNILTFRYTEPLTWWMPMDKSIPRTMEAAVAEAARLAEKGNPSAKALQTSGYHDEGGRLPARLLDTPWCNGAVWSMNSSPGVPGEVTDFKNKWNPAVKEKLYGAARKGDLDGEYVDSTEGYVTDVLDFRREHFAGQKTPLVFASDTKAPAVFRGLIAYEYARGIAADVHAMGKLMMCNGVPGTYPWLPPLFDVLGTETDWNPGGRWRPMSDDDLMYRRVMCGKKPYCFLMNTNFDKFSHALVEKYMKRCLAYGMFPGFFSADASTGHYFSRPDLYERDRPLFRKYVPLVKRVAEAGWQPVTRARSSDPKVYAERFGDRYVTLFNDSAQARTVSVTFEGKTPPKCRELVSGTDVSIENGAASLTLGPEDAAVLDLAQ